MKKGCKHLVPSRSQDCLFLPNCHLVLEDVKKKEMRSELMNTKYKKKQNRERKSPVSPGEGDILYNQINKQSLLCT